MNDTFRFRIASENDISSIMKIENSSFISGISEREDVFSERIDVFPDGFYLLEVNNISAGYISTEIWDYKEEADFESFKLGHSIKEKHNPLGNELYISSIALLPDFRGRGFGEAMFRECRDRIINNNKNIESEILIASEDWTKPIKLYEACGFHKIYTFKNFFTHKNDHNADGIVMRKSLN